MLSVGPPRSCQRNVNVGRPLFSLTDQRIATFPPRVDSAPCLIALVPSSWMTSAKPCVALGLSTTKGPSKHPRQCDHRRDIYVVDRPGDTIQEAANNGIDSVEVIGGSNYALAADVEHLTYSGISRFTANGNGLANIITGGNGVDTVNGAGGNDKLLGLAGDDILFGGVGADRLDGGAGNDRLTGDGGKDTFVFRSGYGMDRILDFSASGSNSDSIEIGGTPYASFAELQAAGAISQAGGNVVVTLGADTLTINGVTIANIANDFLFVA